MAVQLDQVRDPRPKTAPDPPIRDPLGVALAEDVRAAVSRVCGPWGIGRSRTSDSERDALAQTLALWALEHPQRVKGRPTYERRALYRTVLAQNLLTDRRDWQDSLDGRVTMRTRARTADGKRREMVLSESAGEQAERYRASEREQRQSTFLSLEVAGREPEQGRDWLTIAAEREHERRTGETDPPAALAEHSRELTAAVLAELLADLSARGISADLGARQALEVALRMASGETLATLAGSRQFGAIATVKRRSAAGAQSLALLWTREQLAGIRRRCADELGMVDERASESAAEVIAEAPALEAASAALSAADRSLRIAAPRKRGEQSESTSRSGRPVRAWKGEQRRGSAADVLRWISALERALATMEAPAVSIRTDGASAAPDYSPMGWRHPRTPLIPGAAAVR